MTRFARALPAVVCLACSTAPSATLSPFGIGVQFHAPQALLDDVQTVTLYVVDAATVELTCDEATGMVGGATGLISNEVVNQETVVKVPLGRTRPGGEPCPNGGVFCSEDIVLPRDPSTPLIFQALGSASGKPIAVGCTTAAVNSDPFYVTMYMLRYVAPAVCGDGVLQVGEQCEGTEGSITPDDPLCDLSCKTKELLLSSDHAGPSNIKITNAPAGSKAGVALAWSQAPNASNPSPLHAVFEDTNFGSTGTGPEVNYRQMGQDLRPIEYPPLLSSQIRLPLHGGATPGFDQRPRTQAAPAIATMTDGSFVVAYEDDRLSTSANISLTAVSLDVATPRADEVSINKLGVDACGSPTVAGGPTDRALIAWTDHAGRRIRGRIWSKTGWVWTSDTTLSAQEGDNPRATGWNDGWVVAWQGRSNEDNEDVLLVQVEANGTVGAPIVVNERRADVQDRPAIAAMPTGEFAVVWHDTGRIMIQRFDVSGQPLAGDQEVPVGEGSLGAGNHPAVAASTLASGFYAVAWQTPSGEIRGRLLDRTGGYLYNSVDGQTSSFLVNRADVAGQRTRPAVVIGGAGHIVFAWQDDSVDHNGIWARRFPLPSRD
jgi:hypothetical protein